MRLLGLDLGERRIGAAVSDALGWTAQPLTTIPSRGLEADLERVAGLCAEHQVEGVVVGLPLRLDGTSGPEAERARAFAGRLAARLGIPVETWDERLTTRAAERAMVDADLSRARRRRSVDAVAAALMLQSYLDSRRARAGEAPRHG